VIGLIVTVIVLTIGPRSNGEFVFGAFALTNAETEIRANHGDAASENVDLPIRIRASGDVHRARYE
jgi:hypothetical protein